MTQPTRRPQPPHRPLPPRRPPPRSSRRAGARLAALLAILALPLLLVVAFVVVPAVRDDPAGPEGAIGKFADAWTRGDDRAAAELTHQPGPAFEALQASRRGLDGAKAKVRVVSVRESETGAGATLRVEWQVPGYGKWSYETRAALAEDEDETGDTVWEIRWRPRVIHPALTETTRLGTDVQQQRRGEIRDRNGQALVSPREVMNISVEVDRVRNASATAATLAGLVDVDEGRLRRSIQDAPPGRFVPVITLRIGAYRRIAEELEEVAGISLARGSQPLAETKTFARALLGTVAEATAEQLEKLGDERRGEQVGQSGLQAAFEQRLAGRPGFSIVIRETKDGAIVRTVERRRVRDGRPLQTTLDADAQRAAEQALGSEKRNAALVAVQPSSGDILAVANRPADSAFDRALEGRYAPGSTFKVVSTAALLTDGLSVQEPVNCPPTLTVGGKPFRNFEGGAAGRVPFSQDFAQSCNTAFVSLAKRLSRQALPRAGRQFGLGRTFELPLPAATASVPPARNRVGQAAMMIGQDRILVTPLTMAGVAATVADGRWRAPRLVESDRSRAGQPLSPALQTTLQGLMRQVVVAGTGTALAGVPGEPAGKSGTAEYGSGNPPPTHAWFIAYRGDVAIAVLVEGGRAGGEVAAPIAASVLHGAGAC